MKPYELQNVYKYVDSVHRSEKAPMLLRVVPHYHYSDDGDTFQSCFTWWLLLVINLPIKTELSRLGISKNSIVV